MEAATITQETEQSMYQQGKYPSIVTTDDLVFELGKQLVSGLNKEKLLDALLEKSKKIENVLVETNKTKLGLEKKITGLEYSNEQCIKNNQELDAETKKGKTTEDLLAEVNKAKQVVEKEMADLKFSNEKYVENNRKLDFELVRLRNKNVNMKASYEENILQLQEKNDIDLIEYEQKIQKLKTNFKKALKLKKIRKKKINA